MSKVVSSPVALYPGTVAIHDPMTFEQVCSWEEYGRQVNEVLSGDALLRHYQAVIIPAICAQVEEWHLTYGGRELGAITLKNFPFSPYSVGSELVEWLVREIRQVYAGETVPPA